MHTWRTPAATLGFVAACLVPTGAGHASIVDETVFLDTHSPGNAGSGGAVTTGDVLEANKLYVMIAAGTYSKWRIWSQPCGTPEPEPTTRSPGITNGPVGVDSETIFAYQRMPGETCRGLPIHHQGLLSRFEAGAFTHVEPFGGAKHKPASDHTYRYGVRGRGLAASFKTADRPVNDNYGVLRLRLRAATASDCAEGWRSFQFSSQAKCEEYFVDGGNTIVNPPGTPPDTGSGDPGGSGGTGGPGNPGGPGAPGEAAGLIGGSFVISRRAVKVSRSGSVRVRVSCRSPLPCRGKLTLHTVRRFAVGGGKKAPLQLGRAVTFDVPPKVPGVSLSVRLKSSERNLMRELRVTAVEAEAQVVLGSTRASGTVTRRFRLHREARGR